MSESWSTCVYNVTKYTIYVHKHMKLFTVCVRIYSSMYIFTWKQKSGKYNCFKQAKIYF